MNSICAICTRDCNDRHQEMSNFVKMLKHTKYDDEKVMCYDGCIVNDTTDYCLHCQHYDEPNNKCRKGGVKDGESKDGDVFISEDSIECGIEGKGSQVQPLFKDLGGLMMYILELEQEVADDFGAGYYTIGYMDALRKVREWVGTI